MTMTIHDERVREILAGTEAPLEVTSTGRQGDLMVKRIGDSVARGERTTRFGAVLAAGSHGEHRLIAEAAVVDLDKRIIDLAEGGIIVHTDVPAGRHRAFRLAPGRWECPIQRELGLDDAVVQVKD